MGKYCRAHIGKTFNNGKLIVVDGGDKNGYVKVKCSVVQRTLNYLVMEFLKHHLKS